MEIWMLVIALLAIAVILLLASVFSNDRKSLEEEFQENSVMQSQEIFDLKERVSALENIIEAYLPGQSYDQDQYEQVEYDYDDFTTSENEENTVAPTANDYDLDETIEIPVVNEVTPELYEQASDLYARGFSTSEISHSLKLTPEQVEEIIDDYIENR